MAAPDNSGQVIELKAESAPITTEIHCAGCGYILRGLTEAGVCPECGLAIERSLRIGLQDSDPQWLRRLEVGSWMIFIAAPVWVASWATLSATDSILVFEIAGLLPAVLHVVAYWMVTCPEPGLSQFANVLRAQKAIRFFAAAYAICIGFRLIVAFGSPTAMVVSLGYPVTMLICIGWTATSLWYFAHLAKRLPAPRLARVIQILLLLPILLAVFAVVGIVCFYIGLGIGESPLPLFAIPVALCGLVWWVAIFLFALRVTKLRREFATPC